MSAGALPHTPLGELTALPQTPSWILGTYFYKGRGRDERGSEGRGRIAPKLKLVPQNYFPDAGAVHTGIEDKYIVCRLSDN